MVVVSVEVDEVAALEVLADMDLLDPGVDHDRAAIGAAIARLLDLLARDFETRCNVGSRTVL
jgi:hypothetical protein